MPVLKLDEEAVFNVARKIAAVDARHDYLRHVCGEDMALCNRVQALLKVQDEDESFLAGPTPALGATPDALSTEIPGAVIGAYKLLEQIGEGGFGIVFMAEQLQPIRRKVALKVLKPGMDTRQVVARFEAERQALALMDHPNIAQVFDGGETATGRPYFVMELVRGVPITDYCDQNHFPVRQRLELFVAVCQAVQHAHQKGIIHRDLKPSNVMVALQDDKPVVKVIDFGIAKATGHQLTAKTLFTNFAQMVGTPLYMSPEQAQMSGLDVDTRSDIYSLGVLLYELLTGTTPFDKERLRTAAFDEIRRIIREEEPPRPSTRLSTLGQAAANVSINRASDPRRLGQVCRGELDWIVMKALDKDRNRRYETANSLGMDVRRYLADEPVLACPPSTWYRFRKFTQRNKAALVTACAAAMAILLTVASLVGAVFMLETTNGSITREQQKTKQAWHAEIQAKAQLSQALQREQQALYFSRIALADYEYVNGNVARAEQILDECPVDLRHFEWYYLKRLCHNDLLTLRVVRTGAWTVAFSPDGANLAMIGKDKVLVCDRKTGQEKLSCRHSGGVTDLAFSRDGKQLAAGSWNAKEVRVWDTTTGQLIHQLQGGTRPGRGLAFSPDGRYLACNGRRSTGQGVIIHWDLLTGTEGLWSTERNINSVAYSPDGRWITAGGEDKTVSVWEAPSGKLIHRLRGHTGPIRGVAFSADGRWLASASDDQTVRVWDVNLGQQTRQWQMHSSGVTCVAFSPDGQRLASAGIDGTVRTWDLSTGLDQFIFRGHTSSVNCVAFSPDSKFLASAGTDETVKVWDASRRQEGCIVWRHPHRASGFAARFSPDGRYLVTAVSQESMTLSDIWTGREVLILPGNGTDARFSSQGSYLVATGNGKTVKLWDLNVNLEVPTPLRAVGAPYALSADGRRLVTITKNVINVWNVKTGEELFALKGNIISARPAISPDGQRLLWRPDAGILSFVDAQDGHELSRLVDPELGGDWDMFSHDGRLVVSTRKDNTVKLWEPATGRVIPAPRSKVRPLAFSHDNRRLAVATAQHDDATINLWDTETGTEILRLRNYKQGFVAFSKDGRGLFEAIDGTVRLWDATPPEERPTK